MKVLDEKATGKTIKSYMDKRKITVSDISRRLNVSQQAVYGWITGNKMPTVDNLVILADVLGTTIDRLIVRKEVIGWTLYA